MTADIFKRFIRRKASLIGGIILLLFLLMALIGPFLCTQDPNAQDIANKYAPPSWEHLLGTDNLGRDTLTRMVYGARVSLLVSFVGTIIGSAIGVALPRPAVGHRGGGHIGQRLGKYHGGHRLLFHPLYCPNGPWCGAYPEGLGICPGL